MEEKEFVVLDTSEVQIESLHAFMHTLGYRQEGNSSARFITEDPTKAANKWLSFETAQKLHNATAEDWTEVARGVFMFKPVQLPSIIYNAYGLQMLYATRLVQKVKWQHTRKGGHSIRMTSPMVKPNSPILTNFLGLA